MTAARRIILPNIPMPEPEPKPPRKDSILMPTSYHKFDHLTTNELGAKIRLARLLDLTSIELLNLLVSLRRKGDYNSLNSVMDYLVGLR